MSDQSRLCFTIIQEAKCFLFSSQCAMIIELSDHNGVMNNKNPILLHSSKDEIQEDRLSLAVYLYKYVNSDGWLNMSLGKAFRTVNPVKSDLTP